MGVHRPGRSGQISWWWSSGAHGLAGLGARHSSTSERRAQEGAQPQGAQRPVVARRVAELDLGVANRGANGGSELVEVVGNGGAVLGGRGMWGGD